MKSKRFGLAEDKVVKFETRNWNIGIFDNARRILNSDKLVNEFVGVENSDGFPPGTWLNEAKTDILWINTLVAFDLELDVI